MWEKKLLIMKLLSTLVLNGFMILVSLPKGSHVKSQSNGICFILYQLADNDLETHIRSDLSELTQSAIAQSPSTVTWVYHDALNEGSRYYTGGPLADVFNTDGTPLTERFDGSRYLRWDHDLGKMVVDNDLPSEVNSDAPGVLQAFLAHALTDCVAKGTTEFFLALSSHGGGILGFGGDETIQRRGRKLLQSNADLLSAIEGALSVSGAPSKLNVLGFDACLMQSMDAIDDYANIASYYLASEAIEPGHGWAYNELSASTSALDLALNVVDTFLSSTQGKDTHETPKTLAVVDTAAYPAFRDAWDALCSAMAEILASGNDADFHASVVRARSNTLSFAGSLDKAGREITNTAMDIGDFFAVLLQLCNPDESSSLFTLITNARTTYSAQFIKEGVGPGTSAATGMHITWVSKQDFLNNEATYKEYVLPATDPLPLLGAPNYVRFLNEFYYTSTPTVNVGPSVCQTSSESSRSADSTSTLLIDPTLVILDTVNTEVRSEITRNVDSVLVEYGIDVTYMLQDDRLRRRLDESVRRQQVRRLEAAEGVMQQPLSSFPGQHQAMKWRYRESSDRARRLENDTDFGTDDYFLILGGDLAVEYNGPNVVARWDSTFFWIQSGDDLEPVYAFDDGGGRKSIPVCYFSQNKPVNSLQISLGITVDDAIADLGCEYGFLSFSAAEDSIGTVTLYVYQGNTLSSVSLAAGRSIVPILYIEYLVGDKFVSELLGGFNGLVVPWTPESNFSFFAQSDYANLQTFDSNTAFLQIFAYDDDANISSGYFLPYLVEGNASDTNATNGTSGEIPTESSSSGIRISLHIGTRSIIYALIFVGVTFVFG